MYCKVKVQLTIFSYKLQKILSNNIIIIWRLKCILVFVGSIDSTAFLICNIIMVQNIETFGKNTILHATKLHL